MSGPLFTNSNYVPAETIPLPKSVHPDWFAAYTCANHEKSVAVQLSERDVEHFLPLYETVHLWKDRRKRLNLPLFPGYVFVRIPLDERLKVLRVPGVVRLIGNGEDPVPLCEGEVEALRRGLDGSFHPEPHPFLSAGRRVRVIRGALAGMEGVLLRVNSNFRLIISIHAILRSVSVDIDAADVHLLPSAVEPRSDSELRIGSGDVRHHGL